METTPIKKNRKYNLNLILKTLDDSNINSEILFTYLNKGIS
jgi:hypothetical protein